VLKTVIPLTCVCSSVKEILNCTGFTLSLLY
jgi:hypothetical protein